MIFIIIIIISFEETEDLRTQVTCPNKGESWEPTDIACPAASLCLAGKFLCTQLSSELKLLMLIAGFPGEPV